MVGRTGLYVQQPGHYKAFVPANFPLDPPLKFDNELVVLLSRADLAIGRLDTASDILPNADRFVQMYVNKEALLSSQIEGVTQASLGDVLAYETKPASSKLPPDIVEVRNHTAAMNFGIDRLKELPLSNRLIREIHEKLLMNVRGHEKMPGQFRTSQNWIGPAGSDINTAVFVPPPPKEMLNAMANLESFFHDRSPLPVLIKTGLIHYQFETIHPFLDGNGCMGRLLVVFYLCQQKILKRPLLYLSAFFKEYRDEYYNRLQAVRDQGDIEGWMKFFLTAIWKVSESAANTAHNILVMSEEHRKMIQAKLPGSTKGGELLELLYRHPYVTVPLVSGFLEVTYPTANSLVSTLVQLGILGEVTGRERNRIFRYRPYIELMEKGLDIYATEDTPSETNTVTTSATT